MNSLFGGNGLRRYVSLASVLLVGGALGCSRGPAGVDVPSWDPDDLTADVLERYDSGGDGQLDAAELEKAPGLASSTKFIDSNGDGKLSADELRARFQLYSEVKIGLKGKEFRVTHKGRPVAGAEVTFTPEPYLEGLIEPAKGTTAEDGSVYPAAGVGDLPGLRVGFYRVSITGGSVPAKYNGAESPLGTEVSPVIDDPSNYGTRVLAIDD